MGYDAEVNLRAYMRSWKNGRSHSFGPPRRVDAQKDRRNDKPGFGGARSDMVEIRFAG